MSVSDRIYLFLAEGMIPEYDELVALVGPPSNAYPDKQALADEYVESIDLESEATPFQARLMVYGNKPISTFSILA